MAANLQARLDRQRAFWQSESHDRPVIGFIGTTCQPVDACQAPCEDSDL